MSTDADKKAEVDIEAPVRHGGALAEACRVHGGKPEDWLDLSTGINPVAVDLPDIPPEAWTRLPDSDLFERARRAAGHLYGARGEHFPLPIPGTQAAIQRLPDLVAPDRKVAVLSPTYGEYAAVFRRAGFAIDAVRSLDDVMRAHGAVVIVNPNNPDGRLISRDELLSAQRIVSKAGTLMIVDEAFADLDPANSIAPEAGEREELIVFRSFGKFFGLAGLRLGFALAEARLLTRLERALGPWAVSGPALEIAASVMADTALVEATREGIRKRSVNTALALRHGGLTAGHGQGLFHLVRDDDAAAIHAALLQNKILVRAFDDHPTWLRFGLVANTKQGQRLADALRSIPEISARKAAS